MNETIGEAVAELFRRLRHSAKNSINDEANVLLPIKIEALEVFENVRCCCQGSSKHCWNNLPYRCCNDHIKIHFPEWASA